MRFDDLLKSRFEGHFSAFSQGNWRIFAGGLVRFPILRNQSFVCVWLHYTESALLNSLRRRRRAAKRSDKEPFVKISLRMDHWIRTLKNDGCIILRIDNLRLLSAIHEEIARSARTAKSAKNEKREMIRVQQESACIRALFVL
jgi:hypothetical protein